MVKSRKWLSLVLSGVILAGALSLGGCAGNSTASAASGAPAASSSGKKVLKIGSDCAGAPFVWTQNDDANGAVKINGTNLYANGYDILIAKKICEANNWELEIDKIEWDGLPTAVTSGKIDAFIGGVSITSERKQTMDFTSVYYKADLIPVTKKGNKFESAKSLDDLKGAKATSMQNTIWYDKLTQITGAEVQPGLADVPTLLVAVSSGKADIAVMDKPTAMAAVYTNKDLTMINLDADKSFKVTDEDVDLGIPVKKGNTEVLDGMNKVLGGMTDDDREKLMEQAISVQPISQN